MHYVLEDTHIMAESIIPQRGRSNATALTLGPLAAELLSRLQQDAADAVALPEGSIVLPAVRSVTHCSVTDTSQCAYFDGFTASLYLSRRFRDIGWSGADDRQDADGRKWSRRIVMVANDFGDLVDVRQD